MKDRSKTKQKLIQELASLREQITTLEQSESERNQAVERLVERTDELDRFFSLSLDLLCVADADGYFKRLNPEWEKTLGYNLEELQGKQLWDFVHPDDLESTLAVVSDLAGGKQVLNFTNRYLAKDGNYRWIEWRSVPYQDKLIYAAARDITERKRAEEALTNSEERFRKAFYTTLDSVNINRLEDGRYISINPGFTRITGYTEDDIIGKTALECNIWDNIEDRQKLFAALKKNGEVINVEAAFRMKNGDIRYGLMSASVIDLNGVPHILNITRDITDRKQVEDALRTSEERFRALSENSPDIIYTMNLAGAITYANPSWKRILGHDEESLIGRYFIEFAPENEKRIYRKLFKSIRDDGKFVNNHIGVMLTKDGAERVLSMNTAFHRDSEGHIVSVVGTMKDITEFRDMEKKLIHAQKMEAIGTMAGGIAHDFNNLLMGIQGYASLALMNLDPSDPNYERLKKIEEQVLSGADLSKQLLGFARGGRYEVRPTDINDIIEKTSSMFGRTKKEIIIRRKFRNDLWPVEIDRGQMEQVFMNLYVNAWQAMPAGGEIHLETENIFLNDEQAFPFSVKLGKYVTITVTDTGMGMDEKTRERIFEPFFTTKGMGRGTGLGLAMVYGIIKGHQGLITVDSEIGHGTTFTIYLPATEKQVAKDKAIIETITKGTQTILLVDDEKMVLDVNKQLLESLGYRVYEATNGQDAIAIYMEKRNEIDLIILDMIMPGISGGEVFDRVREINPDIKVILSSGYSLAGRAREILDRGCNSFLQKPFQLERLSQKVRELLD
ncbi:MAG: Sensor histidine kinase RcsC [Syntrophus sp. SKADARSKE-3]|nr:Sensor histidine kinase RcsC [Syntrophus sp. SKADARSKE-3]